MVMFSSAKVSTDLHNCDRRWLFFCIYTENGIMRKKDYTGTVPGQHEGEKIDTESSVDLRTTEQAKLFFETAKNRLLDVNHWHELAGRLLANFQLTDEQGREVNRPVQQGDYFKIDIPGPGTKSGDGYDWVHVEAVDEINKPHIQSIAIRVRPTSNPQNASDKISHFYADEATSNFIVTREGSKITAAIYDRNLKPNKEAENFTDKARNTITGAGAITLFSKIQWKQLANGLVEK